MDITTLTYELRQARDLNAAYLLQLDPDRLMARTRVMCGLQPKKESDGGWAKANCIKANSTSSAAEIAGKKKSKGKIKATP